MLAIFAWSFVIWTTNAAAFWIGLGSFQITVPWSGAFLLQAFVAFGILLPSTPGYFGPFEAACRLTLGFYAVSATRSVSFGLLFHLSAYFVPVVLIGFWSLSRSGISYANIRAVRRADE